MDLAAIVLGLLYDRPDGAWSLRELSQAAATTPDRANAALDELASRGFSLDRQPTHGVRLNRPTLLDAHLVERDLGTGRIGRNAIVFAEVDSTNDVAADSARQADADGLVVLTEHQRRGRGRLGRVWVSPPRENIMMSALLIEPMGGLAHEAVTIATGVAVAEGIEAACPGVACELRWPNDVLIHNAKIAGVLIECQRSGEASRWVLGVGINANAAPPAGAVDQPVTCLADQQGPAVERVEVVRSVLRRLDDWITRLGRNDLDGLHEAWIARCGMINQRVTVRSGDRVHVGRVLDVSPLEGLVLMCDDGQRVHLPADGATLAV
jgi:BirA family transcriptional regulator, biotin operon repressor / biotin---[acetyl-CoA-carboxylase] ligase